jgi:hypothetical protein
MMGVIVTEQCEERALLGYNVVQQLSEAKSVQELPKMQPLPWPTLMQEWHKAQYLGSH